MAEKTETQEAMHASDTASDTDERELAAIGKKSVLRRNFSPLAILGLSSTLIITWEGLFSVFIFGLLNGGPAGLIYGFLFCWLGWAAVVATMGELVSMWPTAGGQYHWTYTLASAAGLEKWKIAASYVTGWQSVIAWQAITASGSYLTATALQGLVINSQSSYVPTRWHGTLLVVAIICFCLLFNTLLFQWFPTLDKSLLFLHITLFIVVLIVLTVMAPEKSSSHDVWALWLNEGGYESKGLSFFVGLITPIFAFAGADGAVHMCEEIRNARSVVPRAMSLSILINGICGFAMLLALLYCIGSIDAALSTPTGYPFIEILSSATSSTRFGTTLSAFIVTMFLFATLNLVATASRQLWAFARDKAVPNASVIAYVHPRMKIPVVSIALTGTITCLLSLINIGSAAVFNAIVSLTIAGFFGSYLIPFSLFLYTRTKYPERLTPGPWTLGKFGPAVNAIAIVWSVLVMFFSFWPTNVPVTRLTMNWSSVLWTAVMVFAVVFWWAHGRGVFKGPVVEVAFPERAREV